MANTPQINERSSLLMKTLVEQYINDGLPVGSKILQQRSGLKLSPATIRNIMSDLEKLGLLHSPHTSAGRIPTNKGFRLFVDKLLSVNPVSEPLEKTLKHSLSEKNHHALAKSASCVLSDITSMASVIFIPKAQNTALNHIEFLPLTENRLLVIMVTADGEVHNKIIESKIKFTQSQLQQMNNYLNEQLTGCSITKIRQKLIEEMDQARSRMDQLMLKAVQLAQNSFVEQEGEDDLFYSGESNLFKYEEMADMETLRNMFQAFQEKQKIIEMLHHVNQAQGVQIFIGRESGYEPFSGCSLVASSYQIDDDTIGVLGVIGPTRMQYNKIIPIVDLTAKLLTSALNK